GTAPMTAMAVPRNAIARVCVMRPTRSSPEPFHTKARSGANTPSHMAPSTTGQVSLGPAQPTPTNAHTSTATRVAAPATRHGVQRRGSAGACGARAATGLGAGADAVVVLTAAAS